MFNAVLPAHKYPNEGLHWENIYEVQHKSTP